MGPLVTPEDISVLLGRELTPAERTRTLLDIEACVAELEAWCRRKFTPVTIYNEKHILAGEPGSLFLRWGDPVGDVLVRYNTISSVPVTLRGETWRTDIHYGLNSLYGHWTAPCFVTYTVDTQLVDEYRESIVRVVKNAVVKTLLMPDVIRFKVIKSYSVEGLSISYGGGAESMNTMTEREEGHGQFTNIDLAPLGALKRRIVI
jgi:hypothetical protein